MDNLPRDVQDIIYKNIHNLKFINVLLELEQHFIYLSRIMENPLVIHYENNLRYNIFVSMYI